MIKRILAATAALVAVGALAAAPASAATCLTIDGNVNGTALPINGSYCLPEAP